MTAEYITSRKNPLMVQIRKLASSRSYRREQGLYLGDGLKLVQEALRWKAPLQTVVVSQGISLSDVPDSVRVVEVPCLLYTSAMAWLAWLIWSSMTMSREPAP